MYCTIAKTTGRVLAERHNVSEREQLARLPEQATEFVATLKAPESVFDFVDAACPVCSVTATTSTR